MREAATARTTISSEKGSRSSSEPPPRPTMSTSAMSKRLAVSIWAAMRSAASSPCTGAGSTTTSMPAARRWSTRRMSRIAAPVGDVTTRHAAREHGQRLLARGVEQPFGREAPLALLDDLQQVALAGGLQAIADQLVVAPLGVLRQVARGPCASALGTLEPHARQAAAEHHATEMMPRCPCG